MLRTLWQSNPVRGLVVLLFVFSCLYRLGGINPLSRLMTLCAMGEYHTFRVDAYVQASGTRLDWGADWARTPDGHYYSNKAPGPMLLAFPLFWPYDRVMSRGLGSPAERDAFRFERRADYLFFLSVVSQVIPVAVLVLFLGWFLGSRHGVPREAILAFSAATLFGNPASFFFSSFFGHGLATWLTLALGVSVWLGKPVLSGLFFGLALLSDYGMMFVFPALLLAVVWCLPDPGRFLLRFILGALAPAALWVFYHTVCFGSPWLLPNAFQNPIYRDMEGHRFSIWGVFVPIADPTVALQLLAGQRRGVFAKSPWVAVALAALWVHRASLKRASPGLKALAVLGAGGFVGLLYMNACFGGWHGGAVPVARYMSASFPLLALTTALLSRAWNPGWRRALYWGIAASCAYFLYYNVFRLPYASWQAEIPPPATSTRVAQAAEWSVAAGLVAIATFHATVLDRIAKRAART